MESSSRVRLDIPMVDYETYLTPNWMSLLSVLRYWEGVTLPESKVKIRLKYVSRSDDKIVLTPLVNLADLDDAARNLGYRVLILPISLTNVQNLIAEGFPVIHQVYSQMNLIFGWNPGCSVLNAYAFKEISNRVINQARKEAKEILDLTDEGKGRSKDRLTTIALEAESEYTTQLWESPALKSIGPLMAIVYPPHKFNDLVGVLRSSGRQLQNDSDGYLAALVGLSFLNYADPLSAVEWAKNGAKKISGPLPFNVAHLAHHYWTTRYKKNHASIDLESQFPELDEMAAYFTEPQNVAFLKKARHHFEADFKTRSLPWMVLDPYIQQLDRSDNRERAALITAVTDMVTKNPAARRYWILLANHYEYASNLPQMVVALEGAVSADPTNAKTKLRLAYGYTLLEQYDQAKEILNQTDHRAVKYEADLPFCLGAVNEWEGDLKKARSFYARAVDMRRYNPHYYLKYGELLLKQGNKKEAEEALLWASKISAVDQVKNASNLLLKQMEK